MCVLYIIYLYCISETPYIFVTMKCTAKSLKWQRQFHRSPQMAAKQAHCHHLLINQHLYATEVTAVKFQTLLLDLFLYLLLPSLLSIITYTTTYILSVFHATKELQRDIEKHSTGVASVLNLCEVLLHDCDACATDTECDSIQQATRSLDRRWRSICALSMERRIK